MVAPSRSPYTMTASQALEALAIAEALAALIVRHYCAPGTVGAVLDRLDALKKEIENGC